MSTFCRNAGMLGAAASGQAWAQLGDDPARGGGVSEVHRLTRNWASLMVLDVEISADRQLRVFDAHDGDMKAVVQHLIAETKEGL